MLMAIEEGSWKYYYWDRRPSFMHGVRGFQELFWSGRWLSRDAFISHKFPGVQAHLYKECQRFNSSTLLVQNLWTCAVQSWKKLASLSLNHCWSLLQFLLCILHWVLPLNISMGDPCYGTDLWNYFVLISTISLREISVDMTSCVHNLFFRLICKQNVLILFWFMCLVHACPP